MKMLVNRATGMVREPLSRPVRRGKTAKDRANGAHATNQANKLARVEWQHDTRATSATFPG